MRRFLLAIGVAVAGPLSAQDPVPAPAGDPEPTAEAQDEQDEQDVETVVVARKIEEPVADLPMSVSVVDSQTIEDAGYRSIHDAGSLVPNLTFTEFTSRRLSFPFIRGIGSGQGDSAIVTYVDGVPQLSTGSTNLPLFGIERVEFLRGPQGTLYGRNALGGVIHMISERPSGIVESEFSVTAGDYDFQELSGWVSGPIGESGAAFRAGGMYSSRDGYTDNRFTGNSVDDRESTYGQAEAIFFPGERSELRFSIYGERARDGGFALGEIEALKDDAHEIDEDFEGIAQRDIVSPAVTWNYSGDTFDFTSITAYNDWDVLETSDFDFSTIDAVRRKTTESQDYFSQEFRFASSEDAPIDVGDGMSLAWVAGVTAFTSDSDLSAANEFRPASFPPPFAGTDKNEGDFDDYGVGLFGQARLAATERLELTAGARYDYESKDADLRHTFESGGFPLLDDRTSDEDDFSEFLPMLAAAYKIGDDTLVYASAAKGYKAGGFNLAAPTPDQVDFDPEESYAYEVGFRQSMMDERISVHGAVFYIDWDDMQLSTFDPTTQTGFVDNAGESTSKGAELEIIARAWEGVDIFGSYGYTDAEFDDFDSFGEDVSDNSLPFAPDRTWNIGGQYTGHLDGGHRWFARAEYVGVGTFHYDAQNRESESYELLNLAAGIEWGDARVDLFVRNALDEEYIPVAFQPNPGDLDMFVGEMGAPKTVGVSLRMRF